MPDAHQSIAAELAPHESNQVIERALVSKGCAIAPRALGQHLAACILGDEMRRGEEALRLAARDECELVAVRAEQRELDARRTCVDDGDRVHARYCSECVAA